MSTFKCINPKSYKLTMNNTYEVLEDLGDSIRIINDNNKVANYHKSLFTEVIEETEPTSVIRTEQDLIDSITFLNDGRIMFTDLQNDEVILSHGFEAEVLSMSCGILEINGINQTIGNIEEGVDTSEEDLIELKQRIFGLFIEMLIHNNSNRRFFLFSTNHDPDYEDYYSVLDNMSQGSFGWEENPNSGNDIRLWVLNRDIV